LRKVLFQIQINPVEEEIAQEDQDTSQMDLGQPVMEPDLKGDEQIVDPPQKAMEFPRVERYK
jgi:hypothetical protein